MFLRPFGLYCSVCFGSLFVSILCTCCSHFFWYCFISFVMQFIPFWVIPRRLSSNCRRFGTHYRFHLHRHKHRHRPMKMEPIVSSETSATRTQTPGNYPKRNKLHLEHGEILKTSKNKLCIKLVFLCTMISAVLRM